MLGPVLISSLIALGLDNLTDIAVDLWNHAPRMIQPPTLSQDEMRQLLSYLWMRQFVYPDANATRGKQVFTQKHCHRVRQRN